MIIKKTFNNKRFTRNIMKRYANIFSVHKYLQYYNNNKKKHAHSFLTLLFICYNIKQILFLWFFTIARRFSL